MGDFEYILCTTDDRVATITINRPEKRNAWNRFVTLEVFRACWDLDKDPDVRAIVVTGAGNTFSVGADLDEGPQRWAAMGAEERERIESEAARYAKPWELDTPIIAAINGAAVGVGLTIPLLWDIRVVAEDAKLGFLFNRRGLLPELNSLWLLSRLIGASRALDLLLTGRLFSGREAAEMGLATRAVPADDVLSVATEIARDIATNVAPASAAATKRLFYRFLTMSDRQAALALETEAFEWISGQADTIEGVTSYMAKRTPDWKLSKHDVPDDLLNSD